MENIRARLLAVADCFYQVRFREGMNEFAEIVEELAQIPELNGNVNALLDALEADDYILAADILCYEMAENPAFK